MSFNSYDSWQTGQPNNPWGGQNTMPPPVVPFRPLNLGNLFEGTFAAIRSNPRVMFAISLITMGVIGAISGVLSAFLPSDEIVSVTTGSSVDFVLDDYSVYSVLANTGAQGLLSIINAAATIVVTGMLVLSVTNAVVGVNVDLRSTWDQLKPHFWRLIGAALLVGAIIAAAVVALSVIPIVAIIIAVNTSSDNATGALIFVSVIAILAAIVVTVWISVRLYFTTMVVVVEGARPTQAVRRSWALTRNAFWRTLGRLILMQIVVGLVVSLLSGAVSLVVVLMGGVLPWALTAFFLALMTSLVSGLAMPISASYGSLMYVDERIRKENLAPALQSALDEARASGV